MTPDGLDVGRAGDPLGGSRTLAGRLRALLVERSIELQPERRTPIDAYARVTVAEARRFAGVELTYLGISPLFNRPATFVVAGVPWTLQPARTEADALVSSTTRSVLSGLAAADIELDLIFVARPEPATSDPVELAPAPPRFLSQLVGAASGLLGPARGDLDSDGAAVSLRSARRAEAAGRALELAAAPLAAAEAAIAGVPIPEIAVVGAAPYGEARVGQPASWFLLPVGPT